MQNNKITDASIHIDKSLFAAIFDLMSVPILTSIYQAINSENNNTDKIRERTIPVQKSENSTIRLRVIQIPPYVYPNLIDENNRDKNKNDHIVPLSPV